MFGAQGETCTKTITYWIYLHKFLKFTDSVTKSVTKKPKNALSNDPAKLFLKLTKHFQDVELRQPS